MKRPPRERESLDRGRGGGPTAGGEGVGEEASREVYHEAYLFMMPTAKEPIKTKRKRWMGL